MDINRMVLHHCGLQLAVVQKPPLGQLTAKLGPEAQIFLIIPETELRMDINRMVLDCGL